jgi:hypothetical protein
MSDLIGSGVDQALAEAEHTRRVVDSASIRFWRSLRGRGRVTRAQTRLQGTEPASGERFGREGRS